MQIRVRRGNCRCVKISKSSSCGKRNENWPMTSESKCGRHFKVYSELILPESDPERLKLQIEVESCCVLQLSMHDREGTIDVAIWPHGYTAMNHKSACPMYPSRLAHHKLLLDCNPMINNCQCQNIECNSFLTFFRLRPPFLLSFSSSFPPFAPFYVL